MTSCSMMRGDSIPLSSKRTAIHDAKDARHVNNPAEAGVSAPATPSWDNAKHAWRSNHKPLHSASSDSSMTLLGPESTTAAASASADVPLSFEVAFLASDGCVEVPNVPRRSMASSASPCRAAAMTARPFHARMACAWSASLQCALGSIISIMDSRVRMSSSSDSEAVAFSEDKALRRASSSQTSGLNQRASHEEATSVSWAKHHTNLTD